MVSQSVEITGKVESKSNVENIHVINKTSKIFTITDNTGVFNITGKLYDTIVFSSIQHQQKEVILSQEIILSKAIFVTLEEQINELDEVMVGKILSGDLLYDIKNTEGELPINFYDVGIPGYTGKIATQSERRLSEASNFRPSVNGNSMGAGGSVSILPLINAITGRTKMLKDRVKKERNADLLRRIKGALSEDFFSVYKLEDSLKNDFFFFCEDDINFNFRCQNKSNVEILEFLKEKFLQYNQNLNVNKD
ncbi:hypothetical protein [Litoribaculum gwangyangense]|uniref:Carboxypeptidase-like regulatory domain-containing protein n=1 Tax=Litoribaculum gwangyangense TaxID=1130722 RepID=A0ABP9CKN1_9FLAO